MIERMKIVFVSEFFPASEQGELRGGTEARLFYIARELASHHDITILAAKEAGMPGESLIFHGRVRVLRCGPERSFAQSGSLIARYRFVRSVQKRLGSLAADMVDAQNFLSYYPVWRSRKRFRKAIITVHDVWIGRWVQLFGISGIVGELYERFVLRRQWEYYIANSEATKKRLLTLGVVADRIRVIYNGIDLAALSTIETKKQGRPTVVYVGRLVDYKRVNDLLHAFRLAINSLPTAQLVIIGVGPQEAHLKKLSAELDLKDSVQFRGHISSHRAVMTEIARAHVFCLPSVIEGFGMVTLEAMALGVPFVNADLPVTKEVTAEQGGVFFPPLDVEALSRRLLSVLRDQTLAERLGDEGRRRAQSFSWDQIGNKTEQLYRECLLDGVPADNQRPETLWP